jgi:hypothetical protein
MTFIKSKYWQIIKQSYLKKHPACQMCKIKGIFIEAKDVQFITIMKDPFLMSAPHNLISVCKECV